MNYLKKIYSVFPLMNRPMAFCAVISALSVTLLYNHGRLAIGLLVLFALLSVSLYFLTKELKILIVIFFVFLVSASMINELNLVSDLEYLNGETVTADFIAIEDAKEYDKYSAVTVYCYNADYLPEKTKFYMRFYSMDSIKCGDRFTATVKLSGIEDTDYKMYNFGNSIYMSCSLVALREYKNPSRFFSLEGRIRRYCINTIRKNFSGDISALLIALNCGDKSFMSYDFYNKTLVCGVAHIMVVSGLHISIILGSFFAFVEKYFYNRYLKALSTLVLIFLICAFCGFTVSVIRAGFMFVFAALAPVFKRVNDSLNSLGIAVTVMLILSPFCVFSISFLLSVLATLSVVWVAPFFYDLVVKKLKIEGNVLKGVVRIVLVSVFAMIFTAPVSIKAFGYVSLLSPIVFLLITFPVSYGLQINTAALMFYSFKVLSFLAKPLFFFSGLFAEYIFFIINTFGTLEFTVYNASEFDFKISIIIIFAIIVFMYLYKYKTRQIVKREVTVRDI